MAATRHSLVVFVAALVAAVAVAPGASARTAEYSQVVLADSPFAYWRLDEVHGPVATDASGHGHHARYFDSPRLNQPGLIRGDADTAVAFGGRSAVRWTPDSSYRGAYSVEAWARPTAIALNENVVATRFDGSDYSFDLKLSRQDARGIRVDVGNGQGQWYVNATVAYPWRADRTYYLAAVVTLQDVTVYVNGTALRTIALGCRSCNPLLFDPAHVLQVARNNQRAEEFSGVVDEVALYETALSAQQIAAHYAAGR